jgi:hypothetical protein
MLRIQRSANGEVTFALSGRLDDEHITELENVISADVSGLPIILDLKAMTLSGQGGIEFLARLEAGGVTLANCPAYVREWITRQANG